MTGKFRNCDKHFSQKGLIKCRINIRLFTLLFRSSVFLPQFHSESDGDIWEDSVNVYFVLLNREGRRKRTLIRHPSLNLDNKKMLALPLPLPSAHTSTLPKKNTQGALSQSANYRYLDRTSILCRKPSITVNFKAACIYSSRKKDVKRDVKTVRLL